MELLRQRQRKRGKRGAARNRRQEPGRRKDNDPLQTFEASGLGAKPKHGDGGMMVEETAEERAKRLNEERKNRVKAVSYP